MTQTTPGIWVSDPAAYQRKRLDLLGDRDPIAVLSETPDVLGRIVRDHAPAQLRARPYPGKWTPNEIVGHLLDTEWVYGYRIRLILCEDEPTILGMDQDLWVAGLRHNECDPGELLDDFRTMRNLNLRVWKSMGPRALERASRHNERGREPLGLMLRMEAGHDLSHIDQLTRYLAAVTGA